jgi:hypothetical protein
MGDNGTETPRHADRHEWHVLDAEAGLECRQASGPHEPNRWEIRRSAAPLDGDDVERYVTVLDDEGLQQLLGDGPNPAGL